MRSAFLASFVVAQDLAAEHEGEAAKPYDSTATGRTAPRREWLRRQHQTVVETRADDDPLRLGVHPARPRQIVRKDSAQLYPTQRIAVAEGVVRRRS